MMAIVGTHGRLRKDRGVWRVSVRLADGTETEMSCDRRSVLRQRMIKRGLSPQMFNELVANYGATKGD